MTQPPEPPDLPDTASATSTGGAEGGDGSGSAPRDPLKIDSPLTLRVALADARAWGLARLDAQVLLGQVLGRPRTWLLAHDDAVLEAAQSAAWRALAQRRSAGEPLAYLVGTREFHGLELAVDARVLIPRPETEGLVDWVLDIWAARTSAAVGAPARAPRSMRLVDLGTGSGAIGIALAVAARARGWLGEIHASDASSDALSVARDNAMRHGVAIDWRVGSWWTPWRGCRFDVAVSNPPYIATRDHHLPQLRHEPLDALVAGEDGLDALREIVARSPEHLEPGGWLVLEHGWDQAEAVQALLQAAGFLDVRTRLDLAGRPRCTGGRMAGTERTAPSSRPAPSEAAQRRGSA